jgi:hypothetical protein
MILTKSIMVLINNKNIEHYKNQNIEVVYGKVYEMEVSLLPRYSKYKILAKCETCGAEKELPIQKYHQNWDRSNSYNCKSCNNITYKKSMLEKYGYDNPSSTPECVEKRKKTCLEKYGNEYAIANNEVKDKIKNSIFDKYGGHHSKVPEIMKKIKDKGKLTKIGKGLVIPDDELNEWELYRRIVRNITNLNRNKLFEDWNGLDYYDDEYIKNNFDIKHTDYDYPTIDHKISVIYGFKNNITPEEIGGIENLCITKKGINSSKSFLIEEDYINKKSQS